MSRGLYPITKGTLQLSGITAMNTTMTNVLLAKMISQKSNPKPLADVLKDASKHIIEAVLNRAEEGKLTKDQITELEELANAYAEILKSI